MSLHFVLPCQWMSTTALSISVLYLTVILVFGDLSVGVYDVMTIYDYNYQFRRVFSKVAGWYERTFAARDGGEQTAPPTRSEATTLELRPAEAISQRVAPKRGLMIPSPLPPLPTPHQPKTSTHASHPPNSSILPSSPPTFHPPSHPSTHRSVLPPLDSPFPPLTPRATKPSHNPLTLFIPPPKVLSTVLCNNQLVLGRCIVQTSLYGSLKLCYYQLISQLETDAISSQSQISQPLAAVGFT